MPLDIRIRFGRAIRRIREEQEINQEEAAERCGLHQTYYSGIERGVRNVSLVNMRADSVGGMMSVTAMFRQQSRPNVNLGPCFPLLHRVQTDIVCTELELCSSPLSFLFARGAT